MLFFALGNWDCQLTLSSSDESYLLWRNVAISLLWWRFFYSMQAIFRKTKLATTRVWRVETWNQKSAQRNWLFFWKVCCYLTEKNQDFYKIWEIKTQAAVVHDYKKRSGNWCSRHINFNRNVNVKNSKGKWHNPVKSKV